jgi:hypothetical protein
MVTRYRERSSEVINGIRNIGGTVGRASGTCQVFKQTITDVTEKTVDKRGYLPVTPAALFKRRVTFEPVWYSGNPSAAGLRWAKALIPTVSQSFGSKPAVSLGSEGEAVTMLLARTNPLRQELDVPVILVELLTMTSLLSKLKGSIVNAGGDLFLRKEFEIDPFMADIKSLDKILELIESRLKEYISLFGKGGLHRRVKLGAMSDSNHTIDPLVTLHSSPSPISVKGVQTKRRKVKWYGSVRWFPNHGVVPEPDPISRVRKVLAQIIGANPRDQGFSQLWELIPFSFMMDYFINLNQILGSAMGRQYVTPRYISVSRVITDVKICRPTTYGAGSGGGYTKMVETTLERWTFPDGYVGDVVFNGLLSQSQLQNLTALIAAMQRRV